MKLPGIASLCFKLKKLKNKRVILEQVACFVPRGLGGLIYWQIVMPFHSYVFKGMICGIARNANCEIIYGPKYIRRNEKI